jgi:hypothetical protein
MNTATSRSTLTLVIALSVFPAHSAAQNPAFISARALTITSADELQDRATALHGEPGRYAEAAQLHKQSAALRAATDPRAVESLMMAAHLYHYTNRLFDARKTMEQAAQRALAGGDIVRASQANIEAALFAHKHGKASEADRLGRIALGLAESPLLSAEQRTSIVGRLRANPSTAALVD